METLIMMRFLRRIIQTEAKSRERRRMDDSVETGRFVS